MRNPFSLIRGRQWLMVALALISFVVVSLSPVVLSLGESATSRNREVEIRTYVDSGKNLEFLERVIAQANGIKNYQPADQKLYVKVDIEKVKNIDLSAKTVYVAGKVSGTWVPGSVGRQPIARPGEYNAMRFRGYDNQDLMEDMFFPGIVQDDYYSYERILFNKLKGKSGNEVFASEYRFSGNLNFSPDLAAFPFDFQSIELAFQHKVLPSYMLKVKALKPAISLGSAEDFLVGSYKVSAPYALPSYVRLPNSESLERFFSFKGLKASDATLLQKVLGAERGLAREQGLQVAGGIDVPLLRKAFFSNEAGPHSIASVVMPIKRQVATTWLKSIFPVSLSLLVLVIASYIPESLAEVRLAIPPTILLSLVFMQQSSHDGLPELAYPIQLDYFYLLAFVVTLVTFFEAIILSYFEEVRSSRAVRIFQEVSRVVTLLTAAFGMPLIWLIAQLG